VIEASTKSLLDINLFNSVNLVLVISQRLRLQRIH